MNENAFSIGVDIGGTFTDVLIATTGGSLYRTKVPSTPEAFERGIIVGVQQLLKSNGLQAGNCEAVIHGTTVATNAIIERKGALTGLITTAGFRDVLELRRIRIPRLYDLTWEKPVPLSDRYLRKEVKERMLANGDVMTPLDEDSVRRAVGELLELGVTAIAVCLINSYANDEHERRIRDIVSRIAPHIYLTISSSLSREMREYERTSTTVINAYVGPTVKQYVEALVGGLLDIGIDAPLLLMQSNGGAMRAAFAVEAPIHIVESGPAAGVVAAGRLADDIGVADVVTLDIGGTTAKASLIEGGKISYSSEYEVGSSFTQAGKMARGGGYVLRAPTIDISEIGAGGGSIVWLDAGDALRVGPQSAGAIPGPVCYQRGGTEPTLTDACLVLGYLPDVLAGGSVTLRGDTAETALAGIAGKLSLDVLEFSLGVYRIAVAAMARAIRSVSVERGKDPRDFDLIAFGGNGGLFCAAVADELELRRIVVPPAAGIYSTFGLLHSNLEHHVTRSVNSPLQTFDADVIDRQWRDLKAQVKENLKRDGHSPQTSSLRMLAELRYVNQRHELSVPWPEGVTSKDLPAELANRFELLHETTYGHRSRSGQVELVALHLIGTSLRNTPVKLDTNSLFAGQPQGLAHRRAWFGEKLGWQNAQLATRRELQAGPKQGPIIFDDFDATVLVPPGYEVFADAAMNLIMERRAKDDPSVRA